MNPQENSQKFQHAGQLFQAGQFDQALALLEELDRAVPGNREILHSKAVCLERLNRVQEALSLCDQLIAQFQDARAQNLKTQLEQRVPVPMSDPGLPLLNIDLGLDLGPSHRPAESVPGASGATASKPIPVATPSSDRIVSVDALRGFIMICIVGGLSYSKAFLHVSETGIWGFLGEQLEHPGWEGLRFYDLIFPTFMFLIGLSLVFSLDKIVERYGNEEAYKRVFKRFVLLFLIGIFCDKGLMDIRDEDVLCGVLQRLAWGYLFASLIYLNADWRVILGGIVVVLIGYWILCTMVPVPDLGVVSLEKGKCWPHYIDMKIPPYYDRDPEGWFSTIPAVCTCLIGVLTGIFLRDNSLPESQVAARLALAGLGLLVVGYIWWYGLGFPVIKRIWSSSYVCCAGGYSLLFLSFFYWVLDAKEIETPLIKPLIWVGMNPLLIYTLNESEILNFHTVAKYLAGGPVAESFGAFSELFLSFVALGVILLVMRYLYEKEIFLRV